MGEKISAIEKAKLMLSEYDKADLTDMVDARGALNEVWKHGD